MEKDNLPTKDELAEARKQFHMRVILNRSSIWIKRSVLNGKEYQAFLINLPTEIKEAMETEGMKEGEKVVMAWDPICGVHVFRNRAQLEAYIKLHSATTEPQGDIEAVKAQIKEMRNILDGLKTPGPEQLAAAIRALPEAERLKLIRQVL